MASANRKREDIEAALSNKGFVSEDRDHRYWTYWTSSGKKTAVWTKTSFGSKFRTIGPPLISAMAAQCALPKARFLDLVDCPLTREKYEELLKTGNHISA